MTIFKTKHWLRYKTVTEKLKPVACRGGCNNVIKFEGELRAEKTPSWNVLKSAENVIFIVFFKNVFFFQKFSCGAENFGKIGLKYFRRARKIKLVDLKEDDKIFNFFFRINPLMRTPLLRTPLIQTNIKKKRATLVTIDPSVSSAVRDY